MHNPKESEVFAADITKVKPNELPRADIWTFGFPCQDISLAGKQKGLEGTRSGLFYKVLELIKDKKEEDKPSILLIENVKNLLSVNGGWDFARILIELDEAGYNAEWQVLNSSWWVPQNRERVFIIGHLRGRCGPKIFPITRSSTKTIKKLIDGHQGNRVYDPSGLSSTLLGSSGGQGGKAGLYVVGNIRSGGQRGRVFDPKGIIGCLTATEYKDPQKILIRPVLTPNRVNKRQNGRRFKEPGESIFTLTASDVHGIAIKEATIKGYSEPFFGAGWIYFGKEKSQVEVVNDIDGELINLFKMIKYHNLEIERLLQYELSSRESFYNYKEANINNLTEIQRAIRFIYLISQSFASRGGVYGYGTTTRPSPQIFNISNLNELKERLRNTYIENLSFEKIFEKYDREYTVFFCDPPYYSTEGYGFEFGKKEHEKLKNTLDNIKGKFVLTLNDHPEVREWYKGYNIEEVEVMYSVAKESLGRKNYKELIITNF